MAFLRISLLGAVVVELDGVPVQIGRRKALALLVYLAITRQNHTRDALVNMFWQEVDAGHGRASLRRALADLVTVLGDDFLESTRDTVGLKKDANVWIDLEDFLSAVKECRQHPHHPPVVCPDCANKLGRAAGLYREDFLSGFSLPDAPLFDEWQFFETESLRKEFAYVLEQLVRYQQEQGQTDNALHYARRWVMLDPLLESPQAALMVLYSHCGQRTAALRQFHEYSHLLAKELSITPSREMSALYKSIEQAQVSTLQQNVTPIDHSALSIPDLTKSTPQINLPQQITPFIGREKELSEIIRLLEQPECRLLTLAGTGGIGKSRLAMRAAEMLGSHFQDGIFFIPLEVVKTPESLVRTIANAFKLSFFDKDDLQSQLLSFLEQRQTLLVLDNFEHILSHSSLVLEIVQNAPRVKIIVTSHTPLSLDAEYIYHIGGLDCPGREQIMTLTKPEEWLQFSAIRLFLQSARRALPGFEPQTGDWFHIAHICVMVEGLPLAIVLAAGWIEVLSPREIAHELTKSLDILETHLANIPERHRSIRSIFNGSLKLLDEKDIQPFIQLSVFQGGFTRQAAQEVTTLSLASLKMLVSRSLVRPDVHYGRYYIHPLLQQYAQLQLDASGKAYPTGYAHAHYFAQFMHNLETDIKYQKQIATLNKIEADFENIRTAWLWAVDHHQVDLLEQMIESLFIFCVQRNLWDEAQSIFDYARQHLLPEPGTDSQRVWGKLLSYFYGDKDNCFVQVQISLEIAHTYGDPAAIAHCQAELGWLSIKKNDFMAAQEYFEESLHYYFQVNDQYYIVLLLRSVGLCSLSLGKWEGALEASRESLRLSHEIGDRLRIAECLNTVGSVSLFMGSYDEAHQHFQQAYHLQQGLGKWSDLVLNYLMLGWLCFLQGEIDHSQKLAEDVLKLATGINMLEAKAVALICRGLAAIVEEDNGKAQTLFQESQTILSDAALKPWASAMNPCISILILWGSAVIACGLDNIPLARRYLGDICSNPFTEHSEVVQLWLLPVEACLQANDGNLEQAAGLLARADHHPLSVRGWLDRCPFIQRLRLRLNETLPNAVRIASDEHRI